MVLLRRKHLVLLARGFQTRASSKIIYCLLK